MGVTTDNDCFFIAPIGEEGTAERQTSDIVLKAIVAPAAKRLGMTAIRADHIDEPGIITTQIVDKLIDSRMVVADLTGGNANVFYELAVRHTFRKPAALIGRHGERLRFDVQAMRMIPYKADDVSSVADATEKLVAQMSRGLEGAVDSPVATAVDRRSRRKDSTERWVAGLLRSLLLTRRSGARRVRPEVPERVIPTLRRIRAELDIHASASPALRATAEALRETLEELEGLPEPPPSPPPFRPREQFYAALEERARNESWLDLETLSRLLRDEDG